MEMIPYFLLMALIVAFAPYLAKFLQSREVFDANLGDVVLPNRWRLFVAFCVGLLPLTLGFALVFSQSWQIVRVETFFTESFYDLRSVTQSAECFSDVGVSRGISECVTGWMIPNYPIAWGVLLGALGLDESTTDILGLIQIFLFSVGVALLIYISQRNSPSGTGLTFMSLGAIAPPQLLAFYTGNVELTLFLLVVVSLTLLLTTRIETRIIGGALLTASVYLKVAIFGSLAGILGLSNSIRTRFALIIGALGTTTFALAIDVSRIQSNYVGSWKLSFGAGVLSSQWISRYWPNTVDGIYVLSFWPKIVDFGLLVSLVLLIYLLLLHTKRWQFAQDIRPDVNFLVGNTTSRTLFLSGAGVYLLSFSVILNFDYRLIFLLPVIVSCSVRFGPERRTLLSTAGLALAVMFLSYTRYPVLGWLGWRYFEIPGDILAFILAVWLGVLTLVVLKQIWISASPKASR